MKRYAVKISPRVAFSFLSITQNERRVVCCLVPQASCCQVGKGGRGGERQIDGRWSSASWIALILDRCYLFDPRLLVASKMRCAWPIGLKLAQQIGARCCANFACFQPTVGCMHAIVHVATALRDCFGLFADILLVFLLSVVQWCCTEIETIHRMIR